MSFHTIAVTTESKENIKAIRKLKGLSQEELAIKQNVINLQLAQRKTMRRNVIRWLLITLFSIMVMLLVFLIVSDSPYW